MFPFFFLHSYGNICIDDIPGVLLGMFKFKYSQLLLVNSTLYRPVYKNKKKDDKNETLIFFFNLA